MNLISLFFPSKRVVKTEKAKKKKNQQSKKQKNMILFLHVSRIYIVKIL